MFIHLYINRAKYYVNRNRKTALPFQNVLISQPNL